MLRTVESISTYVGTMSTCYKLLPKFEPVSRVNIFNTRYNCNVYLHILSHMQTRAMPDLGPTHTWQILHREHGLAKAGGCYSPGKPQCLGRKYRQKPGRLIRTSQGRFATGNWSSLENSYFPYGTLSLSALRQIAMCRRLFSLFLVEVVYVWCYEECSQGSFQPNMALP